MGQSPRHVPGCCPLRSLNREPSVTPMQGSNPTIYAVVLSIMHSLVEMHVSGAATHPDPESYRVSQSLEILQHNLHDLPKVKSSGLSLSYVSYRRCPPPWWLHLTSSLAPLVAYPPESMAFSGMLW
jgi:hypothetical protein